MSLKLGVDVGGTFTDVLLVSEETGRADDRQGPVDAGGPVHGVMAGVEQACETHGVGLRRPRR